MAEVFIKGVKMPKSCSVCRIADWEYDCCPVADRKNIIMTDTSGRPDFCPLVEVPDHGDLIDRDEAIREICRDTFPNFSLAVQRIKCVPAIIPADKGEV